MAYVSLNEGETPESLVNRFRSAVQRSGILRELKNRRYFKTKSQNLGATVELRYTETGLAADSVVPYSKVQ